MLKFTSNILATSVAETTQVAPEAAVAAVLLVASRLLLEVVILKVVAEVIRQVNNLFSISM